MKKIALLIFILSLTIKGFGQKLYSEIDVEIEKINSTKTLPVVDNENNIYLFFISKNSIHYVKNSPNGEKIFENTIEISQPFIFDNSRGHTITDNNKVVLFFSNVWNNEFRSVTIPSSKDEQYELNQFKIKKEKEAFFFFAKSEKRFFLYNYVKKKSILKRYELEKDIKNIIEIDLSNERFYNKKNELCTLYEILRRNKDVPTINNYLKTQSNTLPSSIELVSNKVKVFQGEDYHLITLNHKPSSTRTLKINIENADYDLNYYAIPTTDFSQYEVLKSNSFVFGENLYQLITSKKRINLSAFNLNSKKLLKKYKFNKDDDLTIMNSPITQEGSRISSQRKRTLIKTSQFLRKISSSHDVGLFAFYQGGELNLTIGGTSELTTPVTGIAAPIGSLSAISASFGAYLSYKTTKSIFINCLFDTNFEHLEGDLKENIFDRIHQREKNLRDSGSQFKLKLETVFEYDNYYMQGYYDAPHKKYSLIKHI